MAARFHTTITERGGFRSCRRQWHLGTVQRLTHNSRVPWPLIFGESIHFGLETYYTEFARDITRATEAFMSAWRHEWDLIEQTYGGLAQYMEPEWQDHAERGVEMLRFYDIYDRASPFWNGVEIVEITNVESRLYADILIKTQTTRRHQKDLPLLSGRPDLIFRRDDEEGEWIMDHKTAASAYDARALDVDDQLTGLTYLRYRQTGKVPRGAVYNALMKSPPHPPKLLKDGSLSKDKAQRTTYDLYVAAMNEQGISLEDPDYEGILFTLKEKGWSQFFLRDEVFKNMEELDSFEQRLFYEYEDMLGVLQDPRRAYPNPGQRTCPGCSVVALCQAMEEQGDVDYVRESMFVEQEPRHEVPAEILSPEWKGV